jgi:hypothetical protein
MTRPDETLIPTTTFVAIASCINQDFEDLEFITSVLAKFSRKFTEENGFTKLKSLLSLHSIFHKLDSDPQNVLANLLQSMRKEEDPKHKKKFFSYDFIDSKIASTVAELETFALIKAYYPLVFSAILTRGGDRVSINYEHRRNRKSH